MLTIVAVGGLLLARSRWARPLSLVIAAVWFGVSVAGPIDAGSVTVAVLAAGAAAGAVGPWLGRWLRHLSTADGPPPAAVVLLLSLVATPLVLGLSSVDAEPPPQAWAAVAWSLVLATLLSRAIGWSIWVARFAHLPVVLGLSLGVDPVPAAALLGSAVLEVGLGWRRDVLNAVRPLIPGPTATVPIPPELMDPTIMQAAGLDDRGRPLET
jgi:hypothetical protein